MTFLCDALLAVIIILFNSVFFASVTVISNALINEAFYITTITKLRILTWIKTCDRTIEDYANPVRHYVAGCYYRER